MLSEVAALEQLCQGEPDGFLPDEAVLPDDCAVEVSGMDLRTERRLRVRKMPSICSASALMVLPAPPVRPEGV
jgi:hypothetical protein